MTRVQVIVVGGIVTLLVALTAVVVVLLTRDEDTSFTPGEGPGSVVSSTDLGVPLRLKVSGISGREVTYRSTADDGELVEVTSMILEPGGTPPEGGWPVLAVAHGTTGIDPSCGPSQNAQRDQTITGAAGFVAAGFVVTLTDYRGLGGPGPHPYLDNRAAGLDVIDSVRAARAVFPKSSTKWVAFGHSQGGGAVWAANELAGTYAPELDLLGTAAASGAIDMTPMAQQAYDRQLTPDQMSVLQAVLESHARSEPSFDLDRYRSPAGAAAWDVLSGGCEGDAAQRAAVVTELAPGDIGPQDEAALSELTELLASYALPQQPTTAPLLVVYGGKDELIDEAWTAAAIDAAKALGDDIEVERQPSAGHADLDVTGLSDWVFERAGITPP